MNHVHALIAVAAVLVLLGTAHASRCTRCQRYLHKLREAFHLDPPNR
ncbi:MAG: hypothetical protein HOQ21_09870 [Dermatophilaceae bacterium]|nr:hypothetical protein [Dermatophilaceae bacterium]